MTVTAKDHEGRGWRLLVGDVLERLRDVPDGSVHTCVTSPPYFGLRDYGMAGQIGLEETPDAFVARLVDVFREVRRTLREDGTLWVNMGDSYSGSGRGGNPDAGTKQGTNKGSQSVGVLYGRERESAEQERERMKAANAALLATGCKAKDLIGVPWLLAFALRQPYERHVISRDTDRAWLAAIMDGEGTIGIRGYHSKSNSHAKQPCNPGFIPYLGVSNNDIEILERCREITGTGRVALKQSAGATDARNIVSRRDNFSWRVESRAAFDILCDIYPYLVAKRKQAVLAYTLMLSNRNGRALRGKGVLPREEQEKRETLYRLIKECNQRRPVDIPNWCVEPKVIVEPGWWLRSEIIWAKKAPMPESVRDRPTKAHEQIFLFANSPSYFYDADAIKEKTVGPAAESYQAVGTKDAAARSTDLMRTRVAGSCGSSVLRNVRSVWTLSSEPYPEAHFATFPTAIPERCIKAGTSEKGCCPACLAPWVRITEREKVTRERPNEYVKRTGEDGTGNSCANTTAGVAVRTLGWKPSCECAAGDPIPCTVLEPFAGSGTTLRVARELGRHAVGIELNPQYAELAVKRITAPLGVIHSRPADVPGQRSLFSESA